MCVLQYWTHILTCFVMEGVKPYNIENNVMSNYCGRSFLPQLLADGFVYCGIFWPTFVMADVVAICRG